MDGVDVLCGGGGGELCTWVGVPALTVGGGRGRGKVGMFE